MEKGSGIGLILVVIGVFVGSLLDGVSPVAFFGSPAAFLIVLCSAFGAAIISNTFADAKTLPKLMKKAILPGPPPDATAVIGQIVEFADRARREGLLSLEDSINNADDPFLRKGLQMAVDGADPEVVGEVLHTEVGAMKDRHKVGAAFMTSLGVFAPTFGIIGAVIGLIHTLSDLSDPEKLGAGIAGAFVATFWGVFSANGIFLPIGNKLKRLSTLEVAYNEMIIEGVLSIQAGSSPRVVDDLLQSFLPPATRLKMRGEAEERKSA